MTYEEASRVSKNIRFNAASVDQDIDCEDLADVNDSLLDQIIRDATTLRDAIKGAR